MEASKYFGPSHAVEAVLVELLCTVAHQPGQLIKRKEDCRWGAKTEVRGAAMLVWDSRRRGQKERGQVDNILQLIGQTNLSMFSDEVLLFCDVRRSRNTSLAYVQDLQVLRNSSQSCWASVQATSWPSNLGGAPRKHNDPSHSTHACPSVSTRRTGSSHIPPYLLSRCFHAGTNGSPVLSTSVYSYAVLRTPYEKSKQSYPIGTLPYQVRYPLPFSFLVAPASQAHHSGL